MFCDQSFLDASLKAEHEYTEFWYKENTYFDVKKAEGQRPSRPPLLPFIALVPTLTHSG